MPGTPVESVVRTKVTEGDEKAASAGGEVDELLQPTQPAEKEAAVTQLQHDLVVRDNG